MSLQPNRFRAYSFEELKNNRIHVDANGCWNWLGYVMKKEGYGQAWDHDLKKVDYAHRVFYRKLKGEIQARFDLDHLCRNRRCCNPEHLEAVPRLINVQRGRNYWREQTHCIHGHEFTPENTRFEKQRDSIVRICRACKLIYYRALRQRKKEESA